MKKKLAALLCGVMCVGAFTGCSDTELAYLNLSKDMLGMMSACKAEGSMQAEIDFDALDTFLTEAVGESVLAEGEAVGTALTGKKSVTVDYTMNADLNEMEYDMAFDVTYEGKTYDLGTLYYSLTNGVAVTGDTLIGVYELAADISAEDADSYLFSDAYAADLRALAAENPYIEVVSAAELTGAELDEVMPEEGFAEVYDAAFTFVEEVLDGFETGMVTQTANGYKIEATGTSAAEMLVSLLDFIAANPEQVLDATETYVTAVLYSQGAEETELAEMQNAFADLKASQEEFVTTVESISAAAKEMLADETVATLLDSFTYSEEITKNGDAFDSKGVYAVTNGTTPVLKVTSTSKVEKSAAEVTFPANAASIDTVADGLTALEDKYNPVTGVVASWGWEDTNTMATLYEQRAESSLFSGGAEVIDLVVEDGRAYLPLRAVCDALGEEVTWNNAEKTPYVTQDGESIAMKGLLQDGSAFVGVRDFEKLGYTVAYTSNDGLKEVSIAK